MICNDQRLIRGRVTVAGAIASTLALLSSALAVADPTSSRNDNGRRIYQEHCAACHDHPRENIPSRQFLSSRSQSDIVSALVNGAMRLQAQDLSASEIDAVATWLVSMARAAGETVQPLTDPDPRTNRCTKAPPPFRISSSAWNGWSLDAENSRFHERSDLRGEQLSRLRPRWVFAYPGGAAYGPPSAVGGRVFIGTKSGSVLALDAQTGCTY